MNSLRVVLEKMVIREKLRWPYERNLYDYSNYQESFCNGEEEVTMEEWVEIAYRPCFVRYMDIFYNWLVRNQYLEGGNIQINSKICVPEENKPSLSLSGYDYNLEQGEAAAYKKRDVVTNLLEKYGYSVEILYDREEIRKRLADMPEFKQEISDYTVDDFLDILFQKGVNTSSKNSCMDLVITADRGTIAEHKGLRAPYGESYDCVLNEVLDTGAYYTEDGGTVHLFCNSLEPVPILCWNYWSVYALFELILARYYSEMERGTVNVD